MGCESVGCESVGCESEGLSDLTWQQEHDEVRELHLHVHSALLAELDCVNISESTCYHSVSQHLWGDDQIELSFGGTSCRRSLAHSRKRYLFNEYGISNFLICYLSSLFLQGCPPVLCCGCSKFESAECDLIFFLMLTNNCSHFEH